MCWASVRVTELLLEVWAPEDSKSYSHSTLTCDHMMHSQRAAGIAAGEHLVCNFVTVTAPATVSYCHCDSRPFLVTTLAT